MRAERRAQILIAASRALSEAVTLTAAAAVLDALTSARAPLPVAATALAVFGVTLVLSAILRERGTVRQSAALAAIVIGGAVAWSLILPARPPDVLGVLTRIIGFGLLGEAYLWRLIGVARGAQRWREVRNATLLALFVVIVAALSPGPIDRGPLPTLGLLVAVAGAVALSLSRSVEELSLGTRQIGGKAAPAAATGAAFVLGTLAIVAALLLPAAQALLEDLARQVGPVLSNVLFTILLPLGYLASWFVYAALWLRDLLGIGRFPQLRPPPSPFADDDELQRRLREMEEQRPYVFGAVEVVIALFALLFAIVIVARLIEERRTVLAEGVEIERESVEGIGLGATLGLMFPRRAARPRPPADDGTNAGRLRRIYWSLLDLAQRSGPGWRETAETPAEHERRLIGSGPRWRDASEIVRAFEDLRYGEIDPDGDTVARAKAALARVEAAT